jgi:hypothetical protein
MKNEIDELCLRSQVALQVHFMRCGFDEKDSEMMAARSFATGGTWGNMTTYHETITRSEIRRKLDMIAAELESALLTLDIKREEIERSINRISSVLISIPELDTVAV